MWGFAIVGVISGIAACAIQAVEYTESKDNMDLISCILSGLAAICVIAMIALFVNFYNKGSSSVKETITTTVVEPVNQSVILPNDTNLVAGFGRRRYKKI